MMISDALWEVFKATGHIGAYLLYKDYQYDEAGQEGTVQCMCYLESARAE